MPPNPQEPTPDPGAIQQPAPGANPAQPAQPVYQPPADASPAPAQPGFSQPQPQPQPQPSAYSVPPAVQPVQPAMPVNPQTGQLYGPGQPAAGPSPSGMPYGVPNEPQATAAPSFSDNYQTNSFAAPQSGSSRKKLLLGIGAAVAVLLLVAGGVFALNALQKVSPDQYRTASDAANRAADKLSSMSLEVSSISSELDSSDTQFNNQMDKAKKSVTDFKAAQKDLSKQKALRDKDAKKLYKAYTDKESKYITFTDNYVDSMSKLGPILVRCSNSLKDVTTQTATTSGANTLDSCASDIKNLKGLKDQDVQAFASANGDGMSQIANILRQASSLGSSDYSKRSQLLNQLYDVEDTVGKRVDDISSTLDKKMTDNVPTDELRQLSNKLFDKSLASK